MSSSKILDFLRGQGDVARVGQTETIALLHKTKTRKAVTEAKGPVPAPGQTMADFVRSGPTGPAQSDWPMPRLNLSFVDQIKAFFRPAAPPPPPPVPAHLCPVEDVTEFLRAESGKRGFVWAPPASVITDWCRPQSPFNIQGLALVRLWPEASGGGEYRVAIEKEVLVRLVEIQRAKLQAQPQAPAPPAAPPWRPSLADLEAERAALVRARTTPGQIVARETEAYLRTQREQAERAAQAEKVTE